MTLSNGPAQRDVMEYDVAVVGAGPAGLAMAIRLKQRNPELKVCILEKGSTLGAHILSGAVLEPGPLDALLPEWRTAPLPIRVPVTRDEFRWLGRRSAHKVPWIPKYLHNEGNFIISLGGLVQWLGTQAEALGIDVFAGFAAALPLFDDDGSVAGVQIGDMGVQHDGSRGPNYTPGPEVRARLTVIAEGCRGSLAKVLIRRYRLDEKADPQVYALGMKELWQLPAGRVQPGLVQHTVGWPLGHLPSAATGGSFLYHLPNNQVTLGLIVFTAMTLGNSWMESRNALIAVSDQSLTNGGIMRRNAWGSTIFHMVCAYDRPSVRAASTCPRSTPWMPPRMISAMYAAALTASASVHDTAALMLMPVRIGRQ